MVDVALVFCGYGGCGLGNLWLWWMWPWYFVVMVDAVMVYEAVQSVVLVGLVNVSLCH